jgi:hypothetical protein
MNTYSYLEKSLIEADQHTRANKDVFRLNLDDFLLIKNTLVWDIQPSLVEGAGHYEECLALVSEALKRCDRKHPTGAPRVVFELYIRSNGSHSFTLYKVSP